jgi:hypothetical protein
LIKPKTIWVGPVALMVEMKNSPKVVVGKPARPRRRWEYNIKIHLNEIVVY